MLLVACITVSDERDKLNETTKLGHAKVFFFSEARQRRIKRRGMEYERPKRKTNCGSRESRRGGITTRRETAPRSHDGTMNKTTSPTYRPARASAANIRRK